VSGFPPLKKSAFEWVMTDLFFAGRSSHSESGIFRCCEITGYTTAAGFTAACCRRCRHCYSYHDYGNAG
jgi:hypothetical protein